jgi:imidazolonepropionase-like amidohydrolase
LERAYRIGVELVFAADILRQTPGFTKGQLAIGAIDTWKAAGIPAADILRAMTTNSARLLGIEDQRGGIRQGMAADFIGTTGNPLDDIAVLKQVSFVMKDGVVFRRD